MKSFFKRLVATVLRQQAKRLLRRHQPVIVAVTGSVGKTSTKLAVASLLSSSYQLLVHEGNYNSEFGLPLSLFNQSTPARVTDWRGWWRIFVANEQQIRSSFPYELVILELGADHPGDIQNFVSYLKPTIGIVTAATATHTEAFKTVDAVLAEKWHLATASQFVVLNYDDQGIRERSNSLVTPHVGYGIRSGDYHLDDLIFKPTERSYYGTVKLKEQSLKLRFNTVAEHSLYALLAAIAVADHLNVPATEIRQAVEAWQSPKGRMNLLAGANQSLLLDDTYNSSPAAAKAALQTLFSLPGTKKIAILGSMNELGDLEEESHREVGKLTAKLDFLVTVGRAANEYLADEAIRQGLDQKQVKTFLSPIAAGRYVKDLLEPDTVVLIKGSQNRVFCEEATKELLADPNDASQLVRQGSGWVATKRAQFSDMTGSIIK